jgi:putative addiction module component (TIGR02574 family)
MARTLTQITSDAMKLPPKSRGKLIDRLFNTLDPTVDADADASWKAEVSRRLEMDRKGDLKYVPAEAVLSKLRRMLKKLK